MKNNEIFITGATGIAGGSAIEELNRRSYALRILARKIPDQGEKNNNRYVQGDLAQKENLREVSEANAGIVHYACASLRGRADPQIDIDAMEILLKHWEKGPFIFISSLDVYSSPKNPKLIDETEVLVGASTPYAAGKIACEELLFQAAKTRGRKDFTIFRAPWIFAPNDFSKKHIQERFLQNCEKEIILPGETPAEWEKYIDPWVDARDLAWLVGEAMTHPLGGAGNVVADHFSWHEFFTLLTSAAHLDTPIVHKPIEEVSEYAAKMFGYTSYYSNEKVRKHFGFKPRYQLKDTLQAAFK